MSPRAPEELPLRDSDEADARKPERDRALALRDRDVHRRPRFQGTGIAGKSSKSLWPLIRKLHEERFGSRAD
jgi:hypothetical protein